MTPRWSSWFISSLFFQFPSFAMRSPPPRPTVVPSQSFAAGMRELIGACSSRFNRCNEAYAGSTRESQGSLKPTLA